MSSIVVLLESFSESCIGVSKSAEHIIQVMSKLSEGSSDDIHVLGTNAEQMTFSLLTLQRVK